MNKLATFCLHLKDRKNMAMESIISLINDEALNYFDFIFCEDISKNILDLRSYKYRKDVFHYIINTGDVWNRSKTLNFAFKKAKTPIVITWDADFLFDNDYCSRLYGVLREIDFTKFYVKVPCIESSESWINGEKYPAGTIRGGQWIYSKEVVNTLHGYDENFVDWGHEEIDFYERIMRCYNLDIIECQDLRVTHKSHSDKERNFCKNNHHNYGIRCKHKQTSATVVNQTGWGNSKLVFESQDGWHYKTTTGQTHLKPSLKKLIRKELSKTTDVREIGHQVNDGLLPDNTVEHLILEFSQGDIKQLSIPEYQEGKTDFDIERFVIEKKEEEEETEKKKQKRRKRNLGY